jgi:cytochrome c oxidase subunit III
LSQANITMGAHQLGVMEPSPFAVPSKKLAMWLFIISDAMTFAACLVAYGFLRNSTPNWPTPFHSITNVAIMTFILITSSLTMLIAMRAARVGDKAKAFRWMLITAVLGIAFGLLHLNEWRDLMGEGMTIFKNPWGTGLFGSAFYSITGLHLFHVTCGIIALLVVGIRYKGGRYNADDVEVLGLYWHFVDLVWMFVVPFIYLLNLAN